MKSLSRLRRQTTPLLSTSDVLFRVSIIRHAMHSIDNIRPYCIFQVYRKFTTKKKKKKRRKKGEIVKDDQSE